MNYILEINFYQRYIVIFVNNIPNDPVASNNLQAIVRVNFYIMKISLPMALFLADVMANMETGDITGRVYFPCAGTENSLKIEEIIE